MASVLPLFTTMISARQRVREISSIIAARHDSIRASSLYAGTTKLTNTSDILGSPQPAQSTNRFSQWSYSWHAQPFEIGFEEVN